LISIFLSLPGMCSWSHKQFDGAACLLLVAVELQSILACHWHASWCGFLRMVFYPKLLVTVVRIKVLPPLSLTFIYFMYKNIGWIILKVVEWNVAPQNITL
jgi:hypothetical protein